MASKLSKLEAEQMAIRRQSNVVNRGRSLSPSKSGHNSRSSLILNDEFNRDLKWSITNHDPLERLIEKDMSVQDENEDNVNELWDNEVSEEEHISDNEDNEKFQYDDTGNILPNYACQDDKMNEISLILENSNLHDRAVTKRLEELTANERAFANAKNIGSNVDKDFLDKLKSDKHELTGNELDLSKIEQDAASRKQKLETYSTYRKKIIDQENDHLRPNESNEDDSSSSHDETNEKDFMIPYTSAVEDKLDSEFASKLNETIKEGEIDSNKSQSRAIQVITRGNFFQLINPKVKPKIFLVCMDFSPESIFALEWCLGTVLVDGSVLFIVCVIEENDNNHHLKGNTLNESTRENQRLNMLNKAKQQVLNLLKLTKLQIHIVIEIIHHPIPRHLILEIIENLQPTLAVVGSKGQSAIKGVLLGSLSNYLVTKLTVPVMVVREKLKKINRFKSGSSVFSNNIKPLTLSEARVD
ncbi:uncharacterized protein AC631_04715 [Debaryomyces fabryi]|uniref:UspA domain-containing protein n=1 Tax=Debaryomyces fabryi TaxID=58627 RepID=A0A0V1PTH1_9ASCO|nr:uncharacterized protein AC631_04715 [Debaryomyces fabryi]KRZ99525.1 hypothetical protein AC631_04715 [Debaryomyces fabryi]CUM46463.1 unnamed protein product [Debaryomyces fabryi]